MAEKRNLPSAITANCHTGEFTSMIGKATFLGHDNSSPNKEYLIAVDGEIIERISASGYDIYLDNFEALCPSYVW